jgi:FkbM family methyltransferase
MGIQPAIRRFLWDLGLNVSWFTPNSHPIARRRQIFQCYNIDTVLDVGANIGQYAEQLRYDVRFAKRIFSFEPLSTAFALLKRNARGDPAWDVFNYAIGDSDGTQEINIAGNSYSSSLLRMLPAHLKAAPESKFIGKETIEIKTIDSIFPLLCNNTSGVYMKIDTQGFESRVLAGAERSLRSIDTIQMELSLIPLYDGELCFNEMCLLMGKKGYTLIAIENGYCDPDSGQLLQVDAIFHRFDASFQQPV